MKKAILIFLTIGVAVSIYFGIDGAFLAKEIRKHPRHSLFYDAFNTSDARNYVARLFLLLPGSKAYEQHLTEYLSRNTIADDFINHRIVPFALADKDMSIFYPAIRNLPGSFVIPTLRSRINYRDCEVWSEMSAYYERHNFLEAVATKSRNLWKDIYYPHKHDPSEIPIYIQELVRSDPYIQEELSSCLLRYINLPLEKRKEVGYDLYTLRIFLNWESSTSMKLLKLLSEKSQQGDFDAIRLSIPSLRSKELARQIPLKSIVENNLSQFDFVDQVATILDTKAYEGVSKAIFYLNVQKGDKTAAFSILHFIAHQNPQVAEALTKDIIRDKDSVWRKGVVVVSARHDVVSAVENIDMAFSGNAPRTVPFPHKRTYTWGSKATDKYAHIARHGYQQTGKSYPPIYCKEPLANEVELWQDFIKKYPWHPSTDDAYFRLGYRLLVDKHIQKAKHVIRLAESNEFFDYDVHELFQQLEEEIYQIEKGNSVWPRINISTKWYCKDY